MPPYLGQCVQAVEAMAAISGNSACAWLGRRERRPLLSRSDQHISPILLPPPFFLLSVAAASASLSCPVDPVPRRTFPRARP